jgi:hypothetical protein
LDLIGASLFNCVTHISNKAQNSSETNSPNVSKLKKQSTKKREFDVRKNKPSAPHHRGTEKWKKKREISDQNGTITQVFS